MSLYAPKDGDTGEIFAGLVAATKDAERQPRYRVQDLWLATQAIQHGYSLLTRS